MYDPQHISWICHHYFLNDIFQLLYAIIFICIYNFREFTKLPVLCLTSNCIKLHFYICGWGYDELLTKDYSSTCDIAFPRIKKRYLFLIKTIICLMVFTWHVFVNLISFIGYTSVLSCVGVKLQGEREGVRVRLVCHHITIHTLV